MADRWKAISRATNSASTRLGPLVVAGGRLQAWLLLRTNGRIGGRFFGARVFVLEVMGRRSGALRRVPLLYVEDGGRWAVLAANGGNPKPPAWWLNLRDAGEGTVVLGRRRARVSAREATGPERDRLWDALVANYPPVADYRDYTSRPIPIVVLVPDGAADEGA